MEPRAAAIVFLQALKSNDHERRARVDAEAVDERAPRVLVHVERLGLAAGPVESEHEVGA